MNGLVAAACAFSIAGGILTAQFNLKGWRNFIVLVLYGGMGFCLGILWTQQ